MSNKHLNSTEILVLKNFHKIFELIFANKKLEENHLLIIVYNFFNLTKNEINFKKIEKNLNYFQTNFLSIATFLSCHVYL